MVECVGELFFTEFSGESLHTGSALTQVTVLLNNNKNIYLSSLILIPCKIKTLFSSLAEEDKGCVWCGAYARMIDTQRITDRTEEEKSESC